MNSRSLRRLAGDHAALHNTPLPPNYLFGPSSANDSDLTLLDILLAGPTSTPYESGVFKLHLAIPTTYPNEPPKAFFRTNIFHPNVDDKTGAVCVETLKRDWDPKLSLKDILVTISCLLVQPNASSALNADAGMLLEQADGGWEAFEKRAKLMTRLHARVPRDLKDAVRAAQRRGEDREELERKDSGTQVEASGVAKRKRRGTHLAREMSTETPVEMNKRRAETPPLPPVNRPAPSRPFVVQSAVEDVFGSIRLPAPNTRPVVDVDSDSDSELLPQDQENDSSTSPILSRPPMFLSTVRQGPPVPLGELSISDSSFEEEYPPSPKKSPQKHTRNPSLEHPASPRKSPQKHIHLGAPPTQPRPDFFSRGESSRTAAGRKLFFTPLTAQQETPPLNLGNESSLIDSFDINMDTPDPLDTDLEISFDLPKHKTTRRTASTARSQRRKHFDPTTIPRLARPTSSTPVLEPLIQSPQSPEESRPRSVSRSISPKSNECKVKKNPAQQKEKQRQRLEAKLWSLCGADVETWNRGDFGGFFELRAARW